MNEYGWDDLIINPYGKKVESYIGKEVYYADNPTACLNYANSNDDKMAGILDSIQPGDTHPFYISTRRNYHYNHSCIILKKEKPKPEYVPFRDREEFLQAYEENTSKMKSYGIWVYERIGEYEEDIPRAVVELWGDGIVIGNDVDIVKWKDLIGKFVFENGKPCGRLR